MRVAPFVAVLLVLAQGCVPSDAKMAGTWKEQSKSNGILTNMFSNGSGCTLDLTSDKKFVLRTPSRGGKGVNPVVGQPHSIEGTWSVDNKQVTFKTEKVDGKDPKEAQDAIAKALESAPALQVPDDGSMSPEQKAALDQVQSAVSSSMAKLAPRIIPIPTDGAVSDTYFTLTMNCQGGFDMEFGKEHSDR